MIEVSVEELQKAVESQHNCRASLQTVIPVTEKYGDQTVWEGIVHVFEIEGNPAASVCYAWSAPVENLTRRRFYTVLQIPPVITPQEAVRAAIILDYKQKEGRANG